MASPPQIAALVTLSVHALTVAQVVLYKAFVISDIHVD